MLEVYGNSPELVVRKELVLGGGEEHDKRVHDVEQVPGPAARPSPDNAFGA